jgi:hypothetical protein
MSVEFFGRLGAPALTLLGDLADQAVQAGGPGLSRAAFISVATEARRRPVPRQRVFGLVRLLCPHSGVRPGPVARPLLSLG